jgi:hypothetical protein
MTQVLLQGSASASGTGLGALSICYDVSVPASFSVGAVGYDAWVATLVRVVASYDAAAPSRFHVLGPGVLGAYDAFVPVRFDAFNDATPYDAEVPVEFACVDYAHYGRVYSATVPAAFNCTGVYDLSIPSRFVCYDGLVKKRSSYA